jgi:hypothetical protein
MISRISRARRNRGTFGALLHMMLSRFPAGLDRVIAVSEWVKRELGGRWSSSRSRESTSSPSG